MHLPAPIPPDELPPDELPPAVAVQLGVAVAVRAARVPTCHRCRGVATVSWKRYGTDAEREQHWSALEQHIRSQPNLFDDSNATWSADHSEPVTLAVHGCDEHDLSPVPADGSKKAAAAAKQAGADARALTHDADCGGHGVCQCGGAA